MINKIVYHLKNKGIINTFKFSIEQIISLIRFGRRDIRVGRNARIEGLSRITIGKNFRAGDYLWLSAISECNGVMYDSKIVIKDNVCMHDFIHIGSVRYIEIGNDVLMASKIYISDHNHGNYSGEAQSHPFETPCQRVVSNDNKIIIKDDVWIGEFVSILPGVTIGRGSVIGANAVVTHDIPPYTIAVGNPAKIIKKFNFEKAVWEKV